MGTTALAASATHEGAEWEYKHPVTLCSICSSLHPDDLTRFIHSGASLRPGWSQGEPNVFYVGGPLTPHGILNNPLFDQLFFSAHLTPLEPKTFIVLSQLIYKLTGIEFINDPLRFSAPHMGYWQAGDIVHTSRSIVIPVQ